MSDQQEAITRRLEGETLKGIAKALGRSPSTVHRWVSGVSLSPQTTANIERRHRERIGSAKRKNRKTREAAVGLAPQPEILCPKMVGEKSEAQVLATFLLADKIVLQPFGDSQRYDLVVDEDGDFIRVQCKTAELRGGGFKFATSSRRWSGQRRNYRDEADVFAVYLREAHQVFIFKVQDTPAVSCSVRLDAYGKWRKSADHLFLPDRSLRDYP